MLTKDLRKWVVRRLLLLRKSQECTSTTLQRELAQHQNVTVETSTIRKGLAKEGYHWLVRAKKPKYTPEQKALRLSFANKILRFSLAALRDALNFSKDGVIVVMPPANGADRQQGSWRGPWWLIVVAHRMPLLGMCAVRTREREREKDRKKERERER